LSATLASGGSGLGTKSISFTLNGTSVGSASTNGSGVATLSGVSLSGINAGTYNPGVNSGISASFVGDSSYTASSGSNTLTVNLSAQAALSVDSPDDGTYGDTLVPAASGGSGLGRSGGRPAGTAGAWGTGADASTRAIRS